jgi:hypothetical protein
MNKRIQELMNQAGTDSSGKWMGVEHAEKFAQLIVQDCMDVVDGYTKTRTFETHYDAVAQIENLFGVKHERAN